MIKNLLVITPNGYMLDFVDDEGKILHSHLNSPLANSGRAKKAHHDTLSMIK